MNLKEVSLKYSELYSPTLSKAMNIYDTVKLDRMGRMADFTRWGYAIAEAAGIGGEEFLDAYLNNQNRANEANVLSRRLKEVKSNLELIGIQYTIKHHSKRRRILRRWRFSFFFYFYYKNINMLCKWYYAP